MTIEFRDRIHQEYKIFLDELTEVGGQEQKMHEFLEKRSILLPGIQGVYSNTHHGPFMEIIFSKFQLPGTFRRVPDFLFVSKSSIQLTVVMIEIEDPAKEIFNKDDSFSAKFTQAYQQLEDWDEWVQHGSNQTILREILNGAINHPMMATLPMRVEHVLVYGRRAEYDGMDNRIRRLNQKNRLNFKVMSFDRLECAHYPNNLITVRMGQNGANALEVDERYNYDFVTRSSHRQIHGKKEAVQRNEYMSGERKEVLIERIAQLDKLSDDEALQQQMGRNTMQSKVKNLNGPYVRNESGYIKITRNESGLFKKTPVDD